MENPKKNILILTTYYLPGYKAGGPIRSISNLVSWLGNEFNFKIISIDRDFLETEPYEGININTWNKVGKADVYYLNKNDLTLTHLFKLLKETEYDVVYLNSLFNFWFSILPLFIHKYLLRRNPANVLLIPRGELSKGALSNKKTKKKLYIKLTKIFRFYEEINWQATNLSEKKEIIVNYKNKNNIYISSNLPTPFNASINNTIEKIPGEIKIVYLSRITPKKNINFFLKTLKDVSKLEVVLDLFGLIDDKPYWEKCKETIKFLPVNINANYKGTIKHEEVINTLSQYHLFVLPTKGENYGHAIYESIVAGTPPLISDKTPWGDINAENAGWSVPLISKDFRDVVMHIGEMNSDEFNTLRNSVIQYSTNLIPDKTINELKNLFTEIGNN